MLDIFTLYILMGIALQLSFSRGMRKVMQDFATQTGWRPKGYIEAMTVIVTSLFWVFVDWRMIAKWHREKSDTK